MAYMQLPISSLLLSGRVSDWCAEGHGFKSMLGKEVGGQHSEVYRDILCQITEGSTRSGQMAGDCQEVISGASTTSTGVMRTD